MSFWNLTVTVGNLLAALLTHLQVLGGARLFFLFALLIAVAAAMFAVIARRYVTVDHYRRVA